MRDKDGGSVGQLRRLDVVRAPSAPARPGMRVELLDPTAPPPGERHGLMGIDLDLFPSVTAAAAQLLEITRRRSASVSVFTCNVDHMMLLRQDVDFRGAYQRADVVTVDGSPIALLARRTGARQVARVTGADLVPEMARLGEGRNLRIALVGGASGRADGAADALRHRHPGLGRISTHCPPFGFELGDRHDRALVDDIVVARPDIVVVCLGAPRQELWIDRHKHDFHQALLVGAGASIDFLSGGQRRAPQIFRKTGTEAVFRLVWDFRRLWRRYLLRDSRFVIIGGLHWTRYAARGLRERRMTGR